MFFAYSVLPKDTHAHYENEAGKHKGKCSMLLK